MRTILAIIALLITPNLMALTLQNDSDEIDVEMEAYVNNHCSNEINGVNQKFVHILERGESESISRSDFSMKTKTAPYCVTVRVYHTSGRRDYGYANILEPNLILKAWQFDTCTIAFVPEPGLSPEVLHIGRGRIPDGSYELTDCE